MEKLTIELKKLPAGGAILKCVRADGSVAWQRNDKPNSGFFAWHDLRHYAVETVLGRKESFFGLLAAGWEMIDTTGKGARGRIPDEALATEHLVGLLDAESVGDTCASVEEVNDFAVAHAKQHGRVIPSKINEEDLQKIRALIKKLHAAWQELVVGKTFQLAFPPSAADLRWLGQPSEQKPETSAQIRS